ncbi:MAG TPA: uroporphyrinogen-III synthase [Thermomicrobiales bacterium]|nr:uroporphyrinogen-III synthase [Thermomicrobiales bacterium]
MSGPAAEAALAGLRVVVTRAARQAGDLSSQLESLGAVVVSLPAINIVPLPTEPLDVALRRIDEFDWLVLTSANGVEIVLGRLRALDLAIGAAGGPKIAAIGAATARRLSAAGIAVDFVPERAIAESLLDGLIGRGVAGKRLLLPVAEAARDVLPDGLRAAGAAVEVVHTYRTVLPAGSAKNVIEEVRAGMVDVFTFASPSAVRNTAELVGLPLPPGVAVACIGPVTARAARELGLRVDIVAADHSIPGLVAAIVAWAAGRATQKERADVAC